MTKRKRSFSCSHNIGVFLLYFLLVLSKSQPQNSVRRNLFIDQIKSKSGDSILLIENIPREFGGSSDPYADEIRHANGGNYMDQFAMESNLRLDKAMSYQGPQVGPEYHRQYKRGPYGVHSHRRTPQYRPPLRGQFLPPPIDRMDIVGRFKGCPDGQELLPCKCLDKGSEIHIKCDGSSVSKVQNSLSNLMNSLLHVTELHLIGNSLRHIPPRFFGSLRINKLFLLDNDLSSVSRNSFAGLGSSLEHLYIRDSSLYDLPFDTLDNLNNLRTFVLENTMVMEIPRLYSHSKLELFKIDGSRVSSIPSATFRLMPKLKKLQISNSELQEIDESSFEGLVYLNELNLSENQIQWIHPRAFRTMMALTTITLSDNAIDDPGVPVLACREVTSLKTLDISRNKIRNLLKGSFADMKNVENIILKNNEIIAIAPGAFSKLPNLKTIDLSENLLQNLHGDICEDTLNVEYLNARSNNISHVSDLKFIARTMPNLITLDLDDNRLQLENDKKFEYHVKLEILKLNANELNKLKGNCFQHLPNLKELHLSHNRIKNDGGHQVWDLPKLKLLDVSHNDLETLDPEFLVGIPRLLSLDIGFNIITNIDVETFMEVPYLRTFNMSFNKIRTLPDGVFKGLTDLYDLDMSYNGLSELDEKIFKGLISLENLFITHNQIMNVKPNTFRDTSKLRSLDLSTNILQDLPHDALNDLPSLRLLNVRRNAISAIGDGQLAGLKIVEKLDLSHNHIQTLGAHCFKDLSVLKDLDLSINYIQDLHSNMFSNMKLLERLNISHNFISSLGDTPFENAKRLRILDMTNNSLTFIGDSIKNLDSLQGLFLSHNYIDKLTNTSFMSLPNLNVLYFKNNGLQTFAPATFDNLSSLVFLDLGNNNLAKLPTGSFKFQPSLKELKLDKNEISVLEDLAFTNLFSIQSIELQENAISVIKEEAFDFMPTLKFLNLSRNGLQDVSVGSLRMMPSLDVLDLSWNFIMEINDRSFKNLEWLTVLMLHSNQLCRLSEGSFEGQRSLRVLTLNNNQLSRLHLKALGKTIKGLSLLDMSDNPFRCDCELTWLREFIEEEEDKVVKQTSNAAPHQSNNKLTSNFRKSRHRTFSRFADGLDREFLHRRDSFGVHVDERAPLSSHMVKEYLRELHSTGMRGHIGGYGKSFSSHSNGAAVASLPLPLRKIPTCAGPLKYKGMPITEVPAEAFLCGSSPSHEGLASDSCMPRFLQHPDGIPIGGTGPNTASFLDYNDPILLPQMDKANTSLSGSVTPPPLPHSSTTTIIVVSSTPNDTGVQVTQQHSQKLLSDKKQQSLDYNLVTGDTPTIYAGNPSGDSDYDDSTTSSSLFGSLPSLPSILGTIGSISNLNLPNIGLNVNWPGLSLGRNDMHSVNKMGSVEDGENRSQTKKPPFWVEGPNGPILNPIHAEHDGYPVPNLKNKETIYPASFLSSVLPSLAAAAMSQKNKATNIRFPNTGVESTQPDGFTFPDDSPPLDARGQSGFTFPSIKNFPSILRHQIPDSLPQPQKKPLSSIVHYGPSENSGTPFLPGLHNFQHTGAAPSHIIGLGQGVGTVSKISLKQMQQDKSSDVVWSNPEVINPHSGVSLYQPSEPFKPYQPPHSKNPITIIDAPQHHPQWDRTTESSIKFEMDSTTNMHGTLEPFDIQNADILSYANEFTDEGMITTHHPAVTTARSVEDKSSNYEYFSETSKVQSSVEDPYQYPDYDYNYNVKQSGSDDEQKPEVIQYTGSDIKNYSEFAENGDYIDLTQLQNEENGYYDQPTINTSSNESIAIQESGHDLTNDKTDISTSDNYNINHDHQLSNVVKEKLLPNEEEDTEKSIWDIDLDSQQYDEAPKSDDLDSQTIFEDLPLAAENHEFSSQDPYNSVGDSQSGNVNRKNVNVEHQIANGDSLNINENSQIANENIQIVKSDPEMISIDSIDNENSQIHSGDPQIYDDNYEIYNEDPNIYNDNSQPSIVHPQSANENFETIIENQQTDLENSKFIVENPSESKLSGSVDDTRTLIDTQPKLIENSSLYVEDAKLPTDSSPSMHSNPIVSTLPPFEVTMQSEESTTFVPTLRPLSELTQRPPTVYGTIKKTPHRVFLSESVGNSDDYGPPTVGDGVSVIEGKLTPDRILQIESTRSNLDFTSSGQYNEPPELQNRNQFESLNLYPEYDDELKPINPLPPDVLLGRGVPTISRVRPASVTLIDVHQEKKGRPNSLLPAEADSHPVSHHQQSVHEHPEAQSSDELSPSHRVGSLPTEEEGMDWYYNNYDKVYSNDSHIPIGRNEPLNAEHAGAGREISSVFVVIVSVMAIIFL